MKVSYNWLHRYLPDMPNPDSTAELLTLCGLEVEESTQIGSDFKGIVVGKVHQVKPHPNADRLVVCEVDTGQEDLATIVCGAPNVTAGQNVPVALPGCRLPVPLPDGSPFIIRKASIRGQKSAGMICAEDELGIGDDHSGILVLEDKWSPGTPFSEVYPPGIDTLFEIGLTPNRPDAACHLGIARDLAAVTRQDLLKPYHDLPEIREKLKEGIISISDTRQCQRYVAILIEDVKVADSPDWLKTLLASIGLRPINNVVDITNFVLHELGQPLHAFDYQLLEGGSIDVRSFEQERTFVTLDGEERSVPANALFICDGKKPVALAGIMGGINSEISDQTTHLLIESAYFDPVSIRKTARFLGLQTDSSYRFERGVDPTNTLRAALRCAQLILETCGGRIAGSTDLQTAAHIPREIILREKRIHNILGVELTREKILDILNRLEIETKQADAEEENCRWHCMVPAFRPDITDEIDLVEEVARIYDYNNIPQPDRISMATPQPLPFFEVFRDRVRQACTRAGLREIYTNSLLPDRLIDPLGGPGKVITTLNPITRDQALLRNSLSFGFLRSAAYNFNRGAHGVKFFEIGNVFEHAQNGGTWLDGIHERVQLHMGLAGSTHTDHWKEKARPYDLFDLKSTVQSVLNSCGLGAMVQWRQKDDVLQLIARGNPSGDKEKKTRQHHEQLLGTLSAVKREWKERTDIDVPAFSAEVDLNLLEELAAEFEERRYEPISRFPSFAFDLALVVKKTVAAGDLEKSMYIIAGEQLKTVDVFDVFEGGSLKNDEKSIAFRLTFQDTEKTLTIRDVDPLIKKILKGLDSEFSALLRS